jgi:hypothetical protein
MSNIILCCLKHVERKLVKYVETHTLKFNSIKSLKFVERQASFIVFHDEIVKQYVESQMSKYAETHS